MTDEWVSLAENAKINGKYYKLVFYSTGLSKKVLPGQFVNILLNASLDPFLRRPFSYYRVRGKRIEILYEILGRGTAILATKKKGDTLKIMGPLGRPLTQSLKSRKKRVLIGGGVGVPPLVFLAEKIPVDFFLIGTKSKDEALPKKELAFAKNAKVLYSTNDGSYGTRGYVTVLLEALLKKESPKDLFIQTCGPTAMMQAVLDIARKYGIEGEASIDKPMACGVGACLGCMVKTQKGWVPSCTEGPIFNFTEIADSL